MNIADILIRPYIYRVYCTHFYLLKIWPIHGSLLLSDMPNINKEKRLANKCGCKLQADLDTICKNVVLNPTSCNRANKKKLSNSI